MYMGSRFMDFLVAQKVKKVTAMQETQPDP